MKLKRKFYLPALLVCCGFCFLFVCACTHLHKAGHEIAPGAVSQKKIKLHPEKIKLKSGCNKLYADPALVKGILPNGLRYVFLRNTTPEKRVSLHLDVQTGSVNETEEQRGLAHFMEHMSFNGSTHFKPGKLVEYFQSIGMSFGADANAHTGFFETVYDVLLPAGDKKNLQDGLLVLNDYACGALLLESEIDKERGVILSEKRDRDSASFRTFKALLKFECPGSRIAKRLPIGLTKVIKTARRPLFKEYYDTWYRPENMVIVGVGDFDPVLAEALVKKEFSDMKPRAVKRIPPADNWKPWSGIHAFYHYEAEAAHTDITIERVLKKPFKPDTMEAFKKRSVIRLAESMLQNRLSRLVNTKKSPFSDAGAYSGVFLRNLDFSVITAASEPGKWKKALCELEKILGQALKFGFTAQEMKRAKADYIMALDAAVKEAATRKSSFLARRIIRQINRKRVFQSPEQKRDILKPFINSLTTGDVNKVFADTWAGNQRLVLVTGNALIDSGALFRSHARTPEALILGLYKKCHAQKAAPYHGDQKIAFPYLPEPAGHGKIINQKNIADLGVSVINFKNNIRLNLKKTDFDKGKFLFRIDIDGGRKFEPAHRPGLAMISASVINHSGFGKIDSDQLAEALAGRNIDISFHSGENGFFISGFAASDEAKLVFQLVRNYLVDPGFRKKALELVTERYDQMYQNLMRTPNGMMQLKGKRFLAGGDGRFGLPDLEKIEKIKLDDIKSWVEPYLAHGAVEVSVAGDFEPEKIITPASKYLGTLVRRDDFIRYNKRKSPQFPRGQVLLLKLDTKIPKAMVDLSFLTDDFWNIAQTRRMNILASVFSDRLRKEIREKLGESYSPYAYNDPSIAYKGYGVFHAAATVNPDKTAVVKKEIKRISTMLGQRGITQKELRLALKPVLTHLKDVRRTNSYWLNSVLSGCREHPEKFAWARNMVNEYASISKKEVSDLAEKYFRNQNQALIIIRSR